MPIRSPHGRGAAYRSVWQWPLRSPARLAATAAVLVALAVGISLAAASLRWPTDSRVPGSTGSLEPTGQHPPGASVPASILPPVAPLTPATLPLDRAPIAALQVAVSWSAAWVNHPAGTTAQQWLARLRPLTTPEYLGVLAGVDPANVPATQVTGAPRPVRVSPHSVQVEVPTDALTLLVLLVDTDIGWRVAGYDRV